MIHLAPHVAENAIKIDVLVAQRYILISYHMDMFLSYLLDGDGVV